MVEKTVVLKRQDPFKSKVLVQTQTTKIETTEVAKELKVLVPGYMAPQCNNNLVSKRKSVEPSQVCSFLLSLRGVSLAVKIKFC